MNSERNFPEYAGMENLSERVFFILIINPLRRKLKIAVLPIFTLAQKKNVTSSRNLVHGHGKKECAHGMPRTHPGRPPDGSCIFFLHKAILSHGPCPSFICGKNPNAKGVFVTFMAGFKIHLEERAPAKPFVKIIFKTTFLIKDNNCLVYVYCLVFIFFVYHIFIFPPENSHYGNTNTASSHFLFPEFIILLRSLKNN